MGKEIVKENIQKNTIKIISYCYPWDMNSKEEVRTYLKHVGIGITEIDPPDAPPPDKKIPCFSFIVEMDKAKYIIDILNRKFSVKPLFLANAGNEKGRP